MKCLALTSITTITSERSNGQNNKRDQLEYLVNGDNVLGQLVLFLHPGELLLEPLDSLAEVEQLALLVPAWDAVGPEGKEAIQDLVGNNEAVGVLPVHEVPDILHGLADPKVVSHGSTSLHVPEDPVEILIRNDPLFPLFFPGPVIFIVPGKLRIICITIRLVVLPSGRGA